MSKGVKCPKCRNVYFGTKEQYKEHSCKLPLVWMVVDVGGTAYEVPDDFRADIERWCVWAEKQLKLRRGVANDRKA